MSLRRHTRGAARRVAVLRVVASALRLLPLRLLALRTLAIVLLATGALLVACSGRDAAPVAVETPLGAGKSGPGPSRPVATMSLPSQRPAWLAPLEQAHQLADAAATPAERDAALGAFDRALADLPKGESGFTPGQLWIRQDALARSAELELDAGRFDRAVARTERGLALGNLSSVPLASLQTIRGRALEALGDTEAAVSAYHSALVINQQLMERALGATESGAP